MKKTIGRLLRILFAIVAILFIIFGIIGIRDHLWHLLVAGVMILFLTIFWNFFKKKTAKMELAPWWKKIRYTMLGVLIFFALINIGLIIAGISAAQSDVSHEDVTVVVLGTDVEGDQPSDLLRERLDTAAAYLEEHPDMNVIVSGKGRGEYTEAEVMHQYLVNEGIDAERIFLGGDAQSTPENFSFSDEIIQAENLPSQMLIVTNSYHQMRASIYAEQMNIDAKTLSAKTPLHLLFPLSERERYIIATEWLGLSPDLVNKHQEI